MNEQNSQAGAGQIQKSADQLINHPIIRNLGQLFSAAGFELYLVGGSVRDALLGRSQEDFDFATSASPEQTLSVIRGFADDIWQVGMAFGTIGLAKAQCKIEITTFRQEIYTADSRNPEVSFAPTIESDLSRRDFTINAMAIKLPEGGFIDLFNGLADLAAGRLATPAGPEQSFTDDPLRMLRALRFEAQLNMKPAPEVVEAIVAFGPRLEIISKERVRDELSKLLVSDGPGPAIMTMVETGLAAHVIPELIELGRLRDPAHRHKDVLKHTLTVMANVPPELELRLAALFHDIGKPKTITSDAGEIHFFHHEVVGAKIAGRRLKELRYPVKTIAEVKGLIAAHMRFHTYRLGWTDKAVRKYVREIGPERLPALSTLVRADCTTQNQFLAAKFGRLIDELDSRIAALEAEEESAKIRPALDGDEIMAYLKIGPGPTVGKVLSMLLEARLDGKVKTKPEAYELTRQWAKENLD
ncbi:MAG: CCA tRNA nucleotidyltransferase [Actinomycetota bacterium]|nr:CCA tRNA nucleotidyltransferase [Actinomycetota bacterium]